MSASTNSLTNETSGEDDLAPGMDAVPTTYTQSTLLGMVLAFYRGSGDTPDYPFTVQCEGFRGE